MANTFIIKEDVLNEVSNIMKPTEAQFNANMRYFLRQLKDDPVHAEIPTCIKMANISRSRLIRMLIDRDIVVRSERINDTDKNGNHKTPTMAVKYTIVDKIPDELEFKVSKTDFDRRIEKLRRSIFEKNLPQKKFNTPHGTLTMGFVATGEKKGEDLNEEGGDGGATSANASGSFVQPLFGTMVRRELKEMLETMVSNSDAGARYKNIGGGYEVQLEDGSVEESVVTIENKSTKTLYHICFDGANFSLFRDTNDGLPATHISYVFDELFNAFQDSGYAKLDEEVDELVAKHSSGANFENFDSSYMGTGCGSQAYGWGHYVSTDKKVSNGYNKHFKDNPRYQGNLKYGAYTYKVEIPDDNGRNYILWDGPALPNLPFADNPNISTFGEQYEMMADQKGSSPKAVSLKLANLGYTGIKVLPNRNSADKDDRLAFKKGANYVIFRDEDIKILKKKEYTSKAKRHGDYYLIHDEHLRANLYNPKSGEYLFKFSEWPFLYEYKNKDFIKVGLNNTYNVFSLSRMQYVYPETNPEKWPNRILIHGKCYIVGIFGKYMAFQLFTMNNLFGDVNKMESWGDDVRIDTAYNVAKIRVYTPESNYTEKKEIYIGFNGKVSYDAPQKVYKPMGKVKWVLSKPVFKESVAHNRRVFKITEEQLQKLQEVTSTASVGGSNTDYQYTVPFLVDKNDEVMRRKNGECGSVSINHIDESKKYVNMDVEIRKGGRNAVKMGVEDFKSEMIHAFHEYVIEQGESYDCYLVKTPTPDNFVHLLCYGTKINGKSKITSTLYNDIWQGKYKFDTENVDSVGGIKMSNKGFPYIQCRAGGDWECPVCFFVYFDGTHFRGYVPLKGNALNRNSKNAFGSSSTEEGDIKFIQNELGITSDEAKDATKYLGYNVDACLEDFLSRVEVVGTYKKRDHTDDEKKFDEYRKKNQEEHKEQDRQRELEKNEKEKQCDANIVQLNEKKQTFFEKHGIKEVSCGLGYSEKENKWYGWSHRAIHGFGIGDKAKECYPTGTKEGKIIKTMEQAKEAAKKFAESVS